MRPQSPRTVALLRVWMVVQRSWLMATRLGLAMQPGLATLTFSHYGRTGETFTTDAKAQQKAQSLNAKTTSALGNLEGVIFLGRPGRRRTRLPSGRSVGLPLSELISPATAPAPEIVVGSGSATTAPSWLRRFF